MDYSTQTTLPQPIEPKKKKKRIGLYIFLGIFLVIISIIFWLVGSVFFFKPKNLGVKYTDDDYSKAIEKTKISISINGEGGKSLKDVIDNEEGDVQFDDYKRDTITMSSSEISALVDDMVPMFDNVQVKASEDGIVEGSFAVGFDVLEDLLGDDIEQLPVSIPKNGSINFYTKLNLSVKDDKINASTLALEVGAVSLPKELQEKIPIEDMIEDAFSNLGEMEIHSLTTDEDGNFILDSTYPHTVNITPNN